MCWKAVSTDRWEQVWVHAVHDEKPTNRMVHVLRAQAGGLHKFMDWGGSLLTDSGGCADLFSGFYVIIVPYSHL
jgi:hypothetical protein